VGLKSLKRLNLTNGYPNKNNKNNKVKSKPLELCSLVKTVVSAETCSLSGVIVMFLESPRSEHPHET
jgi:hypothetical protein